MWKVVILIIIGLVIVVIAVAIVYGSVRWQSATQKMHRKLEAARLPITAKTYNAQELTGLPAAVQRYFRAALRDGQPMISALSLEHAGVFNMSETGEQWRPFISSQRVIAKRPGFNWEGRISIIPGLKVWVHDAYIAGEGILHATLLGLFSLVNLRGTPEMAEGELMRFFAEAAWYPTTLLPSQGMQWEAVDDVSARATLEDKGIVLSMLFYFNAEGLIESVRADARGRTVGGAVIPTPWEGRYRDYQSREGMLIPVEGEVAWILPEGRKPYWRGRISGVEYEFAQ